MSYHQQNFNLSGSLNCFNLNCFVRYYKLNSCFFEPHRLNQQSLILLVLVKEHSFDSIEIDKNYIIIKNTPQKTIILAAIIFIHPEADEEEFKLLEDMRR